ncbi:RNA methyltransferase [Xaviernesmea oryzae]|uniref:RNA methyltransferase n=1 Tax=Xaviernesmea oryzae TaxID=464029 RepID=A0A1Q9B266_9HYPH|nr:RNA methyltransferase [Xaviernesmea oryzae]OLP62062.1 RNA methyltransferase [Xaviernesmea oryzae]SEL86254.1 tRNA G18 (ribose-2'-O)-methylase SpoU [Xaviernesmea oryzae]
MAALPVDITDPADPRIAAFLSIRERDLTGREGRFIAEGTVVLRMLAAAHGQDRGFYAEAVLILQARLAGVAEILDRLPPDVPVYVAEAPVFNAIAGFDMHRGVLAIGRRQGAPDLDGVLNNAPSLVLAACGLSNHDNMGALFRNAAAFGAGAVVMDRGSCDPTYRKAIRVSVGAVLTVPFAREGTIGEVIGRLKAQGYALWGLSPRGRVPLDAIPPSPRTALLVGTEGEGLPAEIMAAIDTARIAQAPGLDSLNVATAAAIALHRIAMVNGLIG